MSLISTLYFKFWPHLRVILLLHAHQQTEKRIYSSEIHLTITKGILGRVMSWSEAHWQWSQTRKRYQYQTCSLYYGAWNSPSIQRGDPRMGPWEPTRRRSKRTDRCLSGKNKRRSFTYHAPIQRTEVAITQANGDRGTSDALRGRNLKAHKWTSRNWRQEAKTYRDGDLARKND